jgi:carboxynorspermidine decarboxylase
MHDGYLQAADIRTPAMVFDTDEIADAFGVIEEEADRAGVRVLYSLKACSVFSALERLAGWTSGLACSSLYEARLAGELLGGRGTVHLTTPGLRPDEIDDVAAACDYVVVNSLPQWSRYRPNLFGHTRCGLRVNPQLSFASDERYDPCRRHSKLGVPLSQLVDVAARGDGVLDGLCGLHFHTNCDSDDLRPLLQTVARIDSHLGGLLERLDWVNLGGGYLFSEVEDFSPFHEAVGLLRDTYGVEVFVEPGADLVRESGRIVATVIDLFEAEGKTVAVLDTTVNHMPEVLEFGYRPPVSGDTADGRHAYILAGCTCLAGDVFGEYTFAAPLSVGSRVVFLEQGAYAAVKWHWFNGVNLPTIYLVGADGELIEKQRFTYESFAARCGVSVHAVT